MENRLRRSLRRISFPFGRGSCANVDEQKMRQMDVVNGGAHAPPPRSISIPNHNSQSAVATTPIHAFS